jgi:predicted MFS family arabinose efflux permease
MSLPLGGAVLAFGGQVIIDWSGWRAAYLAYGLALLVLLVLPAALILRRRPEDLNLLPDGGPGPVPLDSKRARRQPTEEMSWSLAEAVRTPSLWLLIAALTVAIVAQSSVTFHQVAHYSDMGIDPLAAAATLSAYGVAGAFATGLWGFLTERFSERRLAIVVLLMAAVVTLYLLKVQTAGEAMTFAVLFGLTSRGEGTLFNIILAQYYGRDSYGMISGFTRPFWSAGNAVGPLLSALAFDVTGSYQVMFVFSALMSVLAAVLISLARKPQRARKVAASAS